jgi:hypothetical protein
MYVCVYVYIMLELHLRKLTDLLIKKRCLPNNSTILPSTVVVRRFLSTWRLSQLDPIEFKHSTIIPQIPQARTIPSIDN